MSKRKKIKRKRFPSPTGIQKPGRYVGHEWNLPDQSNKEGLRVVICYPDVYEIGMSHLGLQILYQILREIDNVIVERVFAPWSDKEKELRKEGQLLRTLESRSPVRDADLICFTIPHELVFTNILNILDLAGIPVRQKDRQESSEIYPTILGGGIGAMNPVPVEPFFDAFVIGEAEAHFKDVLDQLSSNQNRDTLLKDLSSLPGVYVPMHWQDSVPVKKQIVEDLNNAPHPNPQLVPYCRPIHERVVVETARGCPRTCRFCQARIYYTPVRYRDPEQIQKLIHENLQQTGYDEVSLLSLSIADYPGIEDLIITLMNDLKDQNISVSLPSLRPEKLTSSVVEQIRQVRKTGFTLAPEAGTERLRMIIGKPYPKKRLLESVAAVFSAGWKQLKLYFMIGQPFETDDDVRGIVHLIHEILNTGRKVSGNRISLNVSVSTFIPKPHTPFQWVGQASETDILRRQRIIRLGCNSPFIKLSLSELFMSRLEAVLSRGDHRMADVLEKAFRNRCRMDAWDEHVNRTGWQSAFANCGLDIETEATKNFDLDSNDLPWRMIDPLIPVEKLKQDYLKAREIADQVFEEESRTDIQIQRGEFQRNKPPVRTQPAMWRYVGSYQVCGDFRLFAHMEIFAALSRAFRRAKLPLAYSFGFNPHPKLTSMNPSPLGCERWFEPVEFCLTECFSGNEVKNALNAQLPAEMQFHFVQPVENSKVLKKLKRFAFALKPAQNIEKIREMLAGSDIVDLLDPIVFGSEIEHRVKQMDMTVSWIMDSQSSSGLSLRQLISLAFGDSGVPFDTVACARIGWLEDNPGRYRVFGMEEREKIQ